MADKAILSAACEFIGCQSVDVADWKEYEDRVVIVLISGPKYAILKADLAPPPMSRPGVEFTDQQKEQIKAVPKGRPRTAARKKRQK